MRLTRGFSLSLLLAIIKILKNLAILDIHFAKYGNEAMIEKVTREKAYPLRSFDASEKDVESTRMFRKEFAKSVGRFAFDCNFASAPPRATYHVVRNYLLLNLI